LARSVKVTVNPQSGDPAVTFATDAAKDDGNGLKGNRDDRGHSD